MSKAKIESTKMSRVGAASMLTMIENQIMFIEQQMTMVEGHDLDDQTYKALHEAKLKLHEVYTSISEARGWNSVALRQL